MYVFKKGKIQKCNPNYRVSLIYLVFALQTTSHLTRFHVAILNIFRKKIGTKGFLVCALYIRLATFAPGVAWDFYYLRKHQYFPAP